MVTTLLLVVIYLAFISLGLPDTILGVTIKSLQQEFGINLASGGLVSMIITGGTVISSFFSDVIIRKVGSGRVVFISCLTTGLSLLGFSLSPSFFWLIPFAFPLGLGGGTVDAALNNYVALHFKAHHMNWLHSFWGLGATFGPLIMSKTLINSSWRSGYRTISIIQLTFAIILFISLPLWRKHKRLKEQSKCDKTEGISSFKLPGLKLALFTMLLYCSVEIGIGLWSSSYLVTNRGFSIDSAARLIALYYLGITIGRLISGFISFKLSNRELIRFGILFAIAGVILMVLPLSGSYVATGLVLTGLGLGPIFPGMIHETPIRFGRKQSQKIIGYQMAFAYIGSAAVPPLLGLLFQTVGIEILPISFLLILMLLILITELLNDRTCNKT